MKVYVDDIRSAPDETWTLARTINRAINAISQFGCEEISLDHDISHQVRVGTLSRPYPCDECYCAVAHYLAQKYRDAAPEDVPKVYIHSANPVGAADLQAILKNEGGIESVYNPLPAANRLELIA